MAGEAPSATIQAGNAREVTAPRVDGHSITAEDTANDTRSGEFNNGVLCEGAEDVTGQSHHYRRMLDDDGGVLALPDTRLITDVGQPGQATGLGMTGTGHSRTCLGSSSAPAGAVLYPRNKKKWVIETKAPLEDTEAVI